MKAGEKNRGWRYEKERSDLSTFAEFEQDQRAEAVSKNLEEAEGIRVLESDFGAQPVSGDHEDRGQRGLVQILGVAVGGSDAVSLGEVRPTRGEEGVG